MPFSINLFEKGRKRLTVIFHWWKKPAKCNDWLITRKAKSPFFHFPLPCFVSLLRIPGACIDKRVVYPHLV